ncbi:hypothetical protein Q8A67_023730 [Cirrhinus molitorella]|uniref:C-type lectin domain-containing protein n=1 Tax=Cirrhinus molitorella TaxID=172907 RepID=A0AA88P829_9TELE|nr:hypothetical protein Q8A67_023730 [Cirrhinus molitorella]
MDTGARQIETEDIYENTDAMRGKITTETEDLNTTKIQPPEQRGSDCVKIRNYRAAEVCLVLLCVLLLTAVIVLCVILTQEKQQLISKNEKLTNERDQLIVKNTNLTNERAQLRNELQFCVNWTCYQSTCYYISNEMKNWTESRQDCLRRGADLIIINNKEEQDFVMNMPGFAAVYIGLTDIDVESVWTWVDGSILNSGNGSWVSGEPAGGIIENCAVTVAVSLLEFSNLKGSDYVQIRNYRAAVVCLVLLCFLLVTAVIVLCVTFTQERQQSISKNEKLTNEKDQLTDLTKVFRR